MPGGNAASSASGAFPFIAAQTPVGASNRRVGTTKSASDAKAREVIRSNGGALSASMRVCSPARLRSDNSAAT
jgi:hypothetical protein